jgi:WhiB family transcriptional regulator, redox-sensing transcriptional regulator
MVSAICGIAIRAQSLQEEDTWVKVRLTPGSILEEGSALSFMDYPEKLDWQDQAACRQYDNVLFFGEEGESELEKQAREARAKSVCQRCPVSEPCLEFAMETNQKYGIWGGLTDKERASLKRRRARARRAS